MVGASREVLGVPVDVSGKVAAQPRSLLSRLDTLYRSLFSIAFTIEKPRLCSGNGLFEEQRNAREGQMLVRKPRSITWS